MDTTDEKCGCGAEFHWRGDSQTIGSTAAQHWRKQHRCDHAEAKVARVEALAAEWLNQAEADWSRCPDGLCGACTMGNCGSLLQMALEGDRDE